MPLPASYPKHLLTIGDHLRKRRLDLKLSQRDVSRIIGTVEDSITFWENNRVAPKISFYPGIYKFLGYDPFPIDTSTLAGKVKHYRFMNGLNVQRFAKLIHVDVTTVNKWENNKYNPKAESYMRLMKCLDEIDRAE